MAANTRRGSAVPRAVCVLILATVAATAATAVAGGLTATTWQEAQDLSRRHGKPVLIDFFTEW
jgi:anaerobic C4-dicarboxylate transporter